MPKAEVPAIDKRVKRLEGHVVWGVRGVLGALVAGIVAVVPWHR